LKIETASPLEDGKLIMAMPDEDRTSDVPPNLHDILQRTVVMYTTFGINSTAREISRDEIYSITFQPNEIMVNQNGVQNVTSGSKQDIQSFMQESLSKIEGNDGTMRISPSNNRQSKQISIFTDFLTIPLMANIETHVKFVEYCPSIFREIRGYYGVLETYPRSVLLRFWVHNLLVRSAFKENIVSRVTEGGASNAIFFYSEDRTFIVKSCSYEEMKQIRANAESLGNHFNQHRDSLITKVGNYHMDFFS
jgi:hypothetical protein